MRIGVFGSAFNPPSLGHKSAITQALTKVDKVVLVPSYQHAFGKQMADYKVRCELTDAFCYDLQMEGIKVDTALVEHKIPVDGSVYTYDLMLYLQNNVFQFDELSVIIGQDNADNFDKFYKNEEISSRWDLVVSSDIVPIRSTLIRNTFNEGNDISKLVTKSVHDKIMKSKCYKDW